MRYGENGHPACDGCGRQDKALFRTNAMGVSGIFKCRPCIDGVPRIALRQGGEILDAIGLGAEEVPQHG